MIFTIGYSIFAIGAIVGIGLMLFCIIVKDPDQVRWARKLAIGLLATVLAGVLILHVAERLYDGNIVIGSLGEYETVSIETLKNEGKEFIGKNIEIRKVPLASVRDTVITVGDKAYSVTVTNVAADDIKRAYSVDVRTVTVYGVYTENGEIRAAYEHKNYEDGSGDSLIVLAVLLSLFMAPVIGAAASKR